MYFVNFTREPIIETILSPRDGHKLCIRNSKTSGSEEIFVDAIEIVSFGNSVFFRNLEKPKPFLVPVSDYEVFEVKETRLVLKNIVHDRNIKIGGGREQSSKVVKEIVENVEEVTVAVSSTEVSADMKDRKRDRRSRNRRRRLAEERGDKEKQQENEFAQEESIQEELVPQVVTFTHLLPPPPVLISERLGKLREKEAQAQEPIEPVLEEQDPLI